MRSGSRVAFVARRVFGRSRWGAVLLVAVIALGSGATMATVAGGRRAATSYDRMREWSDSADVTVSDLRAIDSAAGEDYLTRIAALPQVEDALRFVFMGDFVSIDGTPIPFLTIFPIALDLGSPAAGRPKVLQGRLPGRDVVTDAVIPFVTAERFELDVGDTMDVHFGSEAETVEVVGIIAETSTFPSLANPAVPLVIFTPAFQAAHADTLDWTSAGLDIRLRDGASVDDLRAAAADAGVPSVFEDTSERALGVRKLLRVQSGVLWLAAAIVGPSSLLAIAQIMRRETSARADALRVLSALGVRRREMVAAGAFRGTGLGLLGAVAGVVAAVAISPLFPLGVARKAEPHPGVDVDAVVVLVGVIVTIISVTAIGAVVTLLATRTATARARRRERRRVSAVLPPEASTGARLASRSMRSAAGAAPFAGVIGFAVVAGVLLGVVALRSDVERLIDDPALSGGTWDITTQFGDDDEPPGPYFAAQPQIAAFTRGNWLPLDIDGRRVFSAFFEPDHGIDVAIDRGRAPRSGTEIALGEAVMRDLDVDVGDTVEVRVPTDFDQTALSTAISATVTGRSVLVAPLYETFGPGGGAAVTLDLVRDGGYPPWEIFWFVAMKDGADDRGSVQEVAVGSGADYWFQTTDPSSVGALRDVRNPPLVLVSLLAVLAVVTLVQRLLVGAGANLRHLAILRSLGFTNRQLTTSGALHGLIVVIVPLTVAVGIGVLAARVVWNWIANYLDVVAVHVVPRWGFAITFVGALAVAVTAGVFVADRARRAPPARQLRTE